MSKIPSINVGYADIIGCVGDNGTTTTKEKKTKKPRTQSQSDCPSISIKTTPSSSQKGWKIKATGITLIEPCEDPGIHIECASTIKEVKDVSIDMGKNGISMKLPTSKTGATVTLSKNVKCGVEIASSSSSVNMFM